MARPFAALLLATSLNPGRCASASEETRLQPPASAAAIATIVPYTAEHRRRIHSHTGLNLYSHRSVDCPATSSDDLGPVEVPTRNGKPVLNLHFHKAGGTMTCILAKVNQEWLDPFQMAHNCNSVDDDPHTNAPNEVTGLKMGAALTCEERMRKIAATRATWVSQERWVDPEHCPDLQYATLLRDPIDRIISNVFEIQKVYGFSHNYTGLTTDDMMRWIEPGARFFDYPTDFMEVSTAALDNFYVRTLNGPDVFFLGAGQITSAHLDAAKDRLKQFAAVLTLDTYDLDKPQLSQLVGWTRALGIRSAEEEYQDQHYGEAPPFSEEQVSRLLSQNALDYDLWCYARQLRSQRTAYAKSLAETSPVGGGGGERR